MPTIEVKRSHSVPMDDAKRRIRGLVDDFLQEYPSLVSGVDWAADGASAQAKGKGFTASFRCDDRTIQARIELSMLLSPIKGKVERSLEQRVDSAFPKE